MPVLPAHVNPFIGMKRYIFQMIISRAYSGILPARPTPCAAYVSLP